jgi:hypothetical protein
MLILLFRESTTGLGIGELSVPLETDELDDASCVSDPVDSVKGLLLRTGSPESAANRSVVEALLLCGSVLFANNSSNEGSLLKIAAL